ncbi:MULTISPECIES: DUF262 domain-containing protein [Sphingobacterium]|uniref:DUF262 domain-containing protein n=1 Tax=Sphingobacterium TaxID=28453 RepID=UPI00104314A7|nr:MULTISPECIES: DUF262 domain-containing protein [Sphingobacterium]MCW2258674.1 hypothetical protein [Sphingobacterium kitahiroshimense]TCR14870.1 uncharacterized protein DUF262 [Sphingobacterium sp. JUb78]
MDEDISLHTKIIAIKDLLTFSNLKLPVYQRPYKWQERHIQQLIEDISLFKNKTAYRLGTLVINKDGTEYNIVDGQQRTISCLLLFKAIVAVFSFKDPILIKEIDRISSKIISFSFSNEISQKNIANNYLVACRYVANLDEDFVRFFLHHCELIYFEINNISEAFQFFDAQNSRGKDLEPHDLLKAYHLREYSIDEEKSKLNDVTAWEAYQSDKLSKLFSEYLFRIRSWSRGESGTEFDKNKIFLFKGVTVGKIGDYKYAEALRILHHYTDEYNGSYHRQIDLNLKSYPFQLDGPILNGRRFFEMISHYKKVFDLMLNDIKDNSSLNSISRSILKVIKEYDGWERTGDTYVRTLFECILVFYIDKFGTHNIDLAIEKLFAWSYKLRLEYYAIQFESVDNHVLGSNMFLDIKNSYTPQEALRRPTIFNFTKKREIPEIEKILTKLYYI